ncbi:MAG: Fic family protein [Akkermansiaceae bacterium]
MINRQKPEEGASLAGYGALVEGYALEVPLPGTLSIISSKHLKYETGGWRIFTPRHAPDGSLYGHLVFALKYEGIDLAVLKAVFEVVGPDEIEAAILREPHGKYARRIWFLYEFLIEKTLNLADANRGNFVNLVDERLQYPGPSRPSKRHRVRNNLPGVRNFCPMIRRTQTLDRFIEQDFSARAREIIGAVHPDVLLRASAFLLLKDSQASYAIEGESPPHNRAERWGRVIGMAGQTPLSKEGLEQLQQEVITDTRFLQMGYRKEGGFIGTRDRSSGMPIPDHLSARPSDLDDLVGGLIATDELLKGSDYPPVFAAAAIAFGFVFIHPFEDGNGRLHRYLLHHVLLESGFTPQGVVFAVSSVILDRIGDYREVLENYSKPRLPLIEWRPTDKGNVEILNETLDLYRYFDATAQAEFISSCVAETVTRALPEEVEYLRKYDLMKSFIGQFFEMPDHRIDLLISFLGQNGGKLSKRARDKEFEGLTDHETKVLEEKYGEVF